MLWTEVGLRARASKTWNRFSPQMTLRVCTRTSLARAGPNASINYICCVTSTMAHTTSWFDTIAERIQLLGGVSLAMAADVAENT